VQEEREGLRGEPRLAELRHLLDSACLSFLGMLPTFTGFSHGVNQSSETKKASLLPALFPLVLLNFEAQAKCTFFNVSRSMRSMRFVVLALLLAHPP
jgi:hypothetical protein